MKLYNNIDLVQLNVKGGQTEVYLPKNVAWRDKVVQKLVIVAPQYSGLVSPLDNTPVLTESEIQYIYLDIYNNKSENLTRSLHAFNVLSTNNFPYEINDTISLSLTRFNFVQAPQSDGCILAYVIYESTEVEEQERNKSVTISLILQANQTLRFSDFIDEYMHVKHENVRGMVIWGNPDCFITLRDESDKLSFNYIYADFFRPQTFGGSADTTQVEGCLFDYIDIDMDNSFITSGVSGGWQSIKITFLY